MASKESSAAGLEINQSFLTHLQDLLHEIYTRIDSVGDRIAFESVSKTWQSLTCFRMQYYSQFKFNDGSPCLMFPNGKLFDPVRSLQYQSEPLGTIPAARGYPTVCAAVDDKVIIRIPRGRYDQDVYVLNPFTKEKRLLPDASTQDASTHRWMHVCSSPLTVICPSNDYLHTIVPGAELWTRNRLGTKENTFRFSVCNAVFCQGKYYFLGYFADLLIHDPKENEVYTYKPPHKIYRENFYYGRQYLLESDGRVLAVFVSCDGSWIRVCRWDPDGRKWEILSSLGDKMLFVSYAQSICVTATLSGTGNKIYFPRFIDGHCLFYSMATKKYHTFKPGSSYPSFHGSESFPHLVWVRPPKSTESTQDGGWHKYNWSQYMHPVSGIRSLLSENYKMNKEVEATKKEIEEQGDFVVSRRHPPTKRQSYPWLMITDGENNYRQTFYSISDDSYSIRYIPELKNQEICGFCQGWLFLKEFEAANFSMLNISTMEKIQLPPIPVESFINHCVLSSPTTMDRSCRVICFKDARHLLSCYIGETEFATRVLTFSFSTVTSFNGRLYVLSDPESYSKYRLYAANLSEPNLIFTPVVIRKRLWRNLPGSWYGMQHYLVESRGELLLVLIMKYGGEVSDHAKILRADFNSGEWVAVDNIGDEALFIDEYRAFSAKATPTNGLRRNCVYVVKWWDRNLYVYDLETQGIGMYLPCNRVDSKESQLCWLPAP